MTSRFVMLVLCAALAGPGCAAESPSVYGEYNVRREVTSWEPCPDYEAPLEFVLVLTPDRATIQPHLANYSEVTVSGDDVTVTASEEWRRLEEDDRLPYHVAVTTTFELRATPDTLAGTAVSHFGGTWDQGAFDCSYQATIRAQRR
jgi:hypothetical protein